MTQGKPCHYCGEIVSGRNLHVDHFLPRSLGGTDDLSNLVYACNSCNATKRHRTFEEARPFLMFRRLKWPTFNREQLEWLRANGFDLSPYDNGKLAFEEQ